MTTLKQYSTIGYYENNFLISINKLIERSWIISRHIICMHMNICSRKLDWNAVKGAVLTCTS